MQQVARNLTGYDGELADARYLIHDRAGRYWPFDGALPGSVQVVSLPPRSPNLNAVAARFVKSIRSEALDHFIVFGEKSLRHLIHQYLAPYHAERNHQGEGIGNSLLYPDERVAADRRGDITKSSRLGGLLHFYHREAA